MIPRLLIKELDSYLSERGLRLKAIVIGGSALALLGITTRQTRDFDILYPVLPEEISKAARAFAEQSRLEGIELASDWLNNGPIQLGDILPGGWELRVQPLFAGVALILTTLGRTDLLKIKLFALCDRGTDLTDCIALSPKTSEFDESIPWLLKQDTNPMWPNHVHATIDDLRQRLGHAI